MWFSEGVHSVEADEYFIQIAAEADEYETLQHTVQQPAYMSADEDDCETLQHISIFV